MSLIVKIVRVRFLEDDALAIGGIPHECYENAVEETHECDQISEAVAVIQREGLTFSATGNEWAAHPDGSQIVDYATAEREEVSAHLVNVRPRDARVIQHLVG